MRPDIGAVVGDKDGHIPENADPAFRTVGPQRRPLLLKEELHHLLNGQLAACVVHHGRNRVGTAQRVFAGPIDPALVLEATPQDAEQGPVCQPRDVVLRELLKSRTVFGPGTVEEVRCCFFYERQLLLDSCSKVTGPIVPGQTLNALGSDPALFDQPFKADQRGVAGKGRECGVRRASVPRWTQRENLPQALLGRHEEVHKAIRRWPKVPNAPVRRQRGDMQQHTGDTFRVHQNSWARIMMTAASC